VGRALVLLPLLVFHCCYGWLLAALARRAGERRAWWAWLPVLNLLLPFALARRSLAWGLLLAVPPLNVLVWVLAWAEALARLGQRAPAALAMPVPLVNLVAMARAAGLSGVRAAAPAGLTAAAVLLAVLGLARAEGVRVADRGRALQRDMQRLGAEDAAERRAALEAIERRGRTAASAGPALARAAAADPDPALRVAAARVHYAVTGAPASGHPETALEGLLDRARGTGERDLPDAELVEAIARAGLPALPRLQRALLDPDAGVRWHAAAALLRLGRAARGAAPALLLAMDDAVWTVRNAAGRALEEVAGPEDVEALAHALGSPSSETRYHVARALGRLGPRAAAAVPVLTAALRDEDWEVRMESVWALSAVGTAARPALPPLRDALSDRDAQVRAAAAVALGAMDEGPVAAAALRRVVDGDPEAEVRRAARAALERIGPRAAAQVP
jgi:HEAT repeat protein